MADLCKKRFLCATYSHLKTKIHVHIYVVLYLGQVTCRAREEPIIQGWIDRSIKLKINNYKTQSPNIKSQLQL